MTRFSPGGGGGGGGGGLTEAQADLLYHRLDSGNTPFTGAVTIQVDGFPAFLVKNTAGTDMLQVNTTGSPSVASVDHIPIGSGIRDLGSTGAVWLDGYITNLKNASGQTLIQLGLVGQMRAGADWVPAITGTYDLGNSSLEWENLHLNGNLDDGTNSLTVANARTAFDHSQATGNPHSADLDDISDVTAPSPSLNDVLTWNGSAWINQAAGGGVSDHGALTGLGDDDHPQYLRSDADDTATGAITIQNDAIGSAVDDTEGLRLQNSTAALTGVLQASPPLVLEGQGFKSGGPGGSGSRKAETLVRVVPTESAGGAAANPPHYLSFLHSRADGAYDESVRMLYANTGNVSGSMSLLTSEDGTFHDTIYPFSIQSGLSNTYMEILNNGGADKGAFFGIAGSGADGDAFELWNYQGGPIEFYTDTVATSGSVRLTIEAGGDVVIANACEIDGDLDHDGSNAGFFGTAPTTQQTVTGSRGGNAALANLLTALANYGLIVDSTTA